jgi:AcrR family transcriptional regulator
MGRTGRRPGESGSREAILEAARSTFASAGYERATIRSIAGAAGVDPALVHHYFGTKEELFVAVIDAPVNPAEAIRAILAEGLDGAGERMVRFFLSIWDEPRNHDALMSVLRGALTNDRAATALREFIGQAILGAVVRALPGPDTALRASLIGSHVVGLAFLRYGLRMEPIASANPDQIAALVGPRIQSYLTPPSRTWP